MSATRFGPALLFTSLLLGACRTPAICEDGYVKRETSSSMKFWQCMSLCSTCGFDGSSAVCEETDDWAHCVCADGQTATWCDTADEEGMRCGETECD